MDDELLSQTFKPFLSHINKIKDLETVKENNTQRNLLLQGFPLDNTDRSDCERPGADQGPQNLRSHLQFASYSSFSNIESIKILDCGDLFDPLRDTHLPEECFKRLQENLTKFYDIPNSTIFLMGGSKELVFYSTSWLASTQKSKIAHIDIDNNPKFKEFKKTLSKEQEHSITEDNIYKIVHFGSQGSFLTEDDRGFLKSHNSEIIWFEKNIRRFKIENSNGPKTQAGTMFQTILSNLEKEVDQILLSINLASINSYEAPGVCSPSLIGLTGQEIIEIATIAAKEPKVKLISLTELNPAVENKKTSQLATDIFYNFCKSICEKNK